MAVKKAVDISYHNGVIDFERLKMLLTTLSFVAVTGKI